MEEFVDNLKFLKVAFDYTPGNIVECQVDGKPGFKAAYDDCKCYVYEPGSEDAKKDAKRRAYMQDYHKQKYRRHGSVRQAVPFFDNSTTPDMTKSEVSPDITLAPKSINNPNANHTDTFSGGGPFGKGSPLGVGDNPMGDELNNPGTATASRKNLNREKENMQEIDTIIRTASKVVREASWFDGSSSSIYTRLEQIQDVIDELKMASSSPNLDNGSLSKLANTLVELESERESLHKVASEYVDFDTEEYLQSLPGGTVASVYRTTDFGTADLGEDDGSLLYRTAKQVESEVADADWVNFVTAGAETWVEDQYPALLESQLSTREAAVYFVEQKTLPILDVQKRAAVITNFVDNVEICRRDKNASLTVNDFNSVKHAHKKSNFIVDDILGNSVNWF